MSELALAASSALWLGILTSISPCPLATNIAAVSFLGRRIDSPRLAFKRLTLIERWVRRILATVFIGVGIYMTLSYTFGLGT